MSTNSSPAKPLDGNGDIATPTPVRGLPKHTNVYTSPPYAAGVPVLELIRKLEEEKSLSREDRFALNAALYNPERREKIVKALRDVELGANPKFAIRRLKTLVYQNGAGECSNKTFEQIAKFQAVESDPNQKENKDVQYVHGINKVIDEHEDVNEIQHPIASPHKTVLQVVGDHPTYDGPGNDNICSKVAKRMEEYRTKLRMKPGENFNKPRKFAVIVGCGSLNPLTRMHMRTYFLAKQTLESRYGYIVLGSILSPAHSSTVRERYRSNVSEILPSPHRLAIAQLMVQESKWITIDPWEITRRRSMDYLSFLDHIQEMLKDQFPDTEVKLIYLCKANMIPKLSPTALRAQNYGCVVVCRPPDSDNLRDSLGSKWNGIVHIVEDTAILDVSMDLVTSRRVREKIKAGAAIEQLVGDLVHHYVITHQIGAKMVGEIEWTDAEKSMPKIASRPAGPTLRSQIVGIASMYSQASGNNSVNTNIANNIAADDIKDLGLRLDMIPEDTERRGTERTPSSRSARDDELTGNQVQSQPPQRQYPQPQKIMQSVQRQQINQGAFQPQSHLHSSASAIISDRPQPAIRSEGKESTFGPRPSRYRQESAPNLISNQSNHSNNITNHSNPNHHHHHQQQQQQHNDNRDSQQNYTPSWQPHNHHRGGAIHVPTLGKVIAKDGPVRRNE